MLSLNMGKNSMAKFHDDTAETAYETVHRVNMLYSDGSQK